MASRLSFRLLSLQRSIVSRSSPIRLHVCPEQFLTSVQTLRHLNTSTPLLKVRKNDKKQKTASTALHHATQTAVENPFVEGALKEMNRCEEILGDELAKHFSLQVDLRLFEDILVKMDDGKEHRMSHLGRVTLKNPQMVMINFAANPTAIKNAKLALQKSMLNVNPQHEGVVLYIPTPKMTRERREQLANDAKGKMLNDYKKALNDIYTQFDKKASRDSKTADEEKKTRKNLLELKRGMEKRAIDIIDNKRKQLLAEVA